MSVLSKQPGAGPHSEHYVYHRVPRNLRGSILYPLNGMREIFPDLYRDLRKNYASREDIAALRIPPLGYCLWNDVLHLSPVHPERIKDALTAAGHELPEAWRRYFQIDARLLEPSTTVVYRLSTFLWSGHFNVAEASEEIGRDCLPFSVETLDLFTEVPAAAREYYASVVQGSGIALFLGIPHVLHQGVINLKQDGISIIEL
jgi:hypothetical protein